MRKEVLKAIFNKLKRIYGNSILKFLLKWFVLALIVYMGEQLAYLLMRSEDIVLPFATFAESIVLVVITHDIMILITRYIDYTESEKFSKPLKQLKDISLFRWAEGLEVEERFFYNALKENIDSDPIKNLSSIKREMVNACAGSVSNLKLLKAYIERKLTHNVFDKIGSLFGGVIVAALSAIINSLVLGAELKIDGSFFSLINVINYGTYVLIMSVFLLYSWNLFTRDRRRLILINKIIDIAIDEIESKENKQT